MAVYILRSACVCCCCVLFKTHVSFTHGAADHLSAACQRNLCTSQLLVCATSAPIFRRLPWPVEGMIQSIASRHATIGPVQSSMFLCKYVSVQIREYTVRCGHGHHPGICHISKVGSQEHRHGHLTFSLWHTKRQTALALTPASACTCPLSTYVRVRATLGIGKALP
jgi:hypothetical protein